MCPGLPVLATIDDLKGAYNLRSGAGVAGVPKVLFPLGLGISYAGFNRISNQQKIFTQIEAYQRLTAKNHLHSYTLKNVSTVPLLELL